MAKLSGIKFAPPPERITGFDILAAAFNVEKMRRDRKAVVDLACGHKAYAGNRRTMVCPRCTEMLRRSIADGSEDYESFRLGKTQDRMVWEADPCRQFNEPTDLDGRFKNESASP